MIKYMWAVEVTEPPNPSHNNWRRPGRYMVVAASIEEAIELTKEHHPDVEFIKVMRDRNVDDVLVMAK
jgi:hypothetical protein